MQGTLGGKQKRLFKITNKRSRSPVEAELTKGRSPNNGAKVHKTENAPQREAL